MPLPKLDNLVKAGQLKAEPPALAEIAGLLNSGRMKLRDAESASLSLESRFDLSYNAAHALALAALRLHGYRSEHRFTVFQCLIHTSNLTAAQVRVLTDAHGKRNRAEYEGIVDVDQATVDSLIRVAKNLLAYHDARKV